eukprot:43092-Prorocentrum_minimum.AAC.3
MVQRMNCSALSSPSSSSSSSASSECTLSGLPTDPVTNRLASWPEADSIPPACRPAREHSDKGSGNRTRPEGRVVGLSTRTCARTRRPRRALGKRTCGARGADRGFQGEGLHIPGVGHGIEGVTTRSFVRRKGSRARARRGEARLGGFGRASFSETLTCAQAGGDGADVLRVVVALVRGARAVHEHAVVRHKHARLLQALLHIVQHRLRVSVRRLQQLAHVQLVLPRRNARVAHARDASASESRASRAVVARFDSSARPSTSVANAATTGSTFVSSEARTWKYASICSRKSFVSRCCLSATTCAWYSFLSAVTSRTSAAKCPSLSLIFAAGGALGRAVGSAFASSSVVGN